MTVQLLCEVGLDGAKTTGRHLQYLWGFVCRSGDGSMKDSEGRTVPQADLTVAGKTFRVYQDLPLDTFGVIGEPFTASSWPSQVKQRIQMPERAMTTGWWPPPCRRELGWSGCRGRRAERSSSSGRANGPPTVAPSSSPTPGSACRPSR